MSAKNVPNPGQLCRATCQSEAPVMAGEGEAGEGEAAGVELLTVPPRHPLSDGPDGVPVVAQAQGLHQPAGPVTSQHGDGASKLPPGRLLTRLAEDAGPAVSPGLLSGLQQAEIVQNSPVEGVHWQDGAPVHRVTGHILAQVALVVAGLSPPPPLAAHVHHEVQQSEEEGEESEDRGDVVAVQASWPCRPSRIC